MSADARQPRTGAVPFTPLYEDLGDLFGPRGLYMCADHNFLPSAEALMRLHIDERLGLRCAAPTHGGHTFSTAVDSPRCDAATAAYFDGARLPSDSGCTWAAAFADIRTAVDRYGGLLVTAWR